MGMRLMLHNLHASSNSKKCFNCQPKSGKKGQLAIINPIYLAWAAWDLMSTHTATAHGCTGGAFDFYIWMYP